MPNKANIYPAPQDLGQPSHFSHLTSAPSENKRTPNSRKVYYSRDEIERALSLSQILSPRPRDRP